MTVSTTTSGEPTRARPGDRAAAPLIHDHLRTEILKGRLDPGSEINQVHIAARFGVSRGPVREACRLLERDGLIDAPVNQRARVAGLSVGDLEHLYTLRVLNESVALSVSVPSFTSAELDDLDKLAQVLMHTDPDTFDFETWDEVHQRFHTMLLVHSGSRMLASAADWAAHTQRYRRAYAEGGRGLPQGAAEHLVLAQLCRDGETRAATDLLALHLSRAALTLIAHMTPTREPVLLRAAIRQVVGADDERWKSGGDNRAGA